jgi:hypothetical protein
MPSSKKTGARALIKNQKSAKGDLVIAAVKAACAREKLPSYLFMFWENGDPKTGFATCHFEGITPRSAINLAMVAIEQAVKNDLAQAQAKNFPPEYAAIMSEYMNVLEAASKQANDALTLLNAKRAGAVPPKAGNA